MTNIIRQRTNMTAMLWAPNTGRGYPYGSSFTTLNPSAADREALDTNKDGVLDSRDDPYGPFYPGDEYVDWVGISAYWYKSPQVPINRYFQLSLKDEQPGEDPIYLDPTGSRKFYERFAAAKDKPMAISETGAPATSSDTVAPVTVAQELEIKQAWWRQLWHKDNQYEFPKLKAITYFEEAKPEEGMWRDWRITANTTVLNGFLDDLRTGLGREQMLWTSNISIFNNGSVGIRLQ